MEGVEQFCYLGDVLDCEAGVERAVRARVTAAWRRWREIASLLVNCNIGLRTRGKVYETCVRFSLFMEQKHSIDKLIDGCSKQM